MKISVVTSDFSPGLGGIAVFLHNLCRELARRGHIVRVLVFGHRPAGWLPVGENEGFELDWISSPSRLSSAAMAYAIVRSTRRFRPDVILMGHEPASEALGLCMSKHLFGTPFALLVHGSMLQWRLHHLGSVDGIWTRLALREATLTIANSAFTRNELIKEGVVEGRIRILNPGVDIDLFRPNGSVTDSAAKQLRNGNKLILSVGRLIWRKNFAAVLHALSAVRSHFPSVLYVIVGDGPERERLEGLASILGLTPFVLFAGYKDNKQLPTYYRAANVFVMTPLELHADHETFGMVYLEANACGIPVIGGRAGGVEDAIIDGETGLLVDPLDISSTSEAIIRMLDREDYAHQLGQNGRARVVRDFTWEKVGERLDGYLESVVAGLV